MRRFSRHSRRVFWSLVIKVSFLMAPSFVRALPSARKLRATLRLGDERGHLLPLERGNGAVLCREATLVQARVYLRFATVRAHVSVCVLCFVSQARVVVFYLFLATVGMTKRALYTVLSGDVISDTPQTARLGVTVVCILPLSAHPRSRRALAAFSCPRSRAALFF